MFFEQAPGSGASITWAARTRGGSGQSVAVLVRVRVASVSGAANTSLLIDSDGASGTAWDFDITDDGAISVSRHNSAGGSSRSSGSGLSAGLQWIWVDMPTSMLTGTNATVYSSGSGAWAAVSMSGATSPGGTANDLNGASVMTLGADGEGDWKSGPLYVWTSAARPDTPEKALEIINGTRSPESYSGLVFAASLSRTSFDSVGAALGTIVTGRFDGGGLRSRGRLRGR